MTVTCHSLRDLGRSASGQRRLVVCPVFCDSTCRAQDIKQEAWSAAVPYAALVARVVVDVMLKPEIHDPQGEAIASACHRLGLEQVVAVRQGKRFEIELPGDGPADEAAVRQVADLAAQLLANPVIEEFTVEPA